MTTPSPEEKRNAAEDAPQAECSSTRAALRATVVGMIPGSSDEVQVTDQINTVLDSIVPPLPPRGGEEGGAESGQSLSLDGTDSPPEFILRSRIGTGGQGEVWDAMQTSLDREVAIKLVRAAADENAEPFLHEAWTVATLDHPNIVPVYELSQTQILGNTCHLLAMKLLRGDSWEAHLERERGVEDFNLDDFLSRHLKILSSVCHALAYAHSKKIVHLDLKPSQVVLGDFGEVYLLDWGLAMSVDDKAPQISSGSQPKFRTKDSTSSPGGTPAYMAPEQALGHTEGLGYHTDIYLLGAILFEIIAGCPPHLSSTVSSAYSRAKQNMINPVPDHCPPDLRLLILSSLSTDPTERPQSVEDFRHTIQEFLGGSSRKRESEEITTEVRAQMDEVKVTSRYEELGEADRRLTRALTLWPGNGEAGELRQTVVRRWTQVALEADDLRLARTILPEIEAEEERERLKAEISTARMNRQRVNRQRRHLSIISGIFFIALIAFGAKYSFDQKVARVRLQDERDRAELSRQQAEGLVNFLIDDMYRGLEPLGRLDLLEQVAGESMDYFESIPAESSDLQAMQQRSLALRNIAEVLRAQGELGEARHAYDAAIATARSLSENDDSPQLKMLLADNLAALSRYLYHQRDLEEAYRIEDEALSIRQAMSTALPDDVDRRDKVAASLNQLGVIRWRQGEPSDAHEYLIKSELIRQKLLDGDPQNEALMGSLSWTLGTMGVILIDQGDLVGALDVVERTLFYRRKLLANEPDNATWKARLAWSLGSLGELQLYMGDPQASLETHRQALALLKGLHEGDPTNNSLPNELAWSHEHAGQALDALGRHDEALGEYERALSLRELTLAQSPDDIHTLEEKAWNLYRVANSEFLADNVELANVHLATALEIAQRLHERSPTNVNQAASLAWMKLLQGRVERREGNHSQASFYFGEALEYITPVTDGSGRVEYCAAHVAALYFSGKTEAAETLHRDLRERGFREPEFVAMLASLGVVSE